MQLKIQMA